MGAACGKGKAGKNKGKSPPQNPNTQQSKDANKLQLQPVQADNHPVANQQGDSNPGNTQKANDPNMNIQAGGDSHKVAGETQKTNIESQNNPTLQLSSANADPKEPISMKNLFLFGIDSDEIPKIIKINPQQKSIETVQLPLNLELFNFSGIVYLNDREIYITGGINPKTLQSSKSAYLYNSQSNTALLLPPLIEPRYSHMVAVFRNKLFVIGGFLEKSEDEKILKSADFLHLVSSSPAWTKAGDLNHPRACGFTIIYNDKLYVIGGYAGKSRRPKQIEIYNENTNKWDLAELKIPKGIEYPVISTADRDEFLVMGGHVRGGVLRSNILINLKTKTFLSKRSMHKERIFHKGIQIGTETWIFGGEDSDTVEIYDSIRDEWRFGDIEYKGQLKDINSFSAASAPFILLSKKDLPLIEFSKSSKTDVRSFLFGDDQTPFILEINFTKKFTKEKQIPIRLKLYAYQGAVNLEDGRYFLCKGLSQHGHHPVSNAYIYDPEKNEAKKCSKSKIPSFAHNVVKKGNHVYVIGGISHKDDQEIILNTCERYDIQKDVWESIPPLNHERCSGMSFILGDKIAVIGGFRGNFDRWSNGEVFEEALGKWRLVSLYGLPPLEGAGVLHSPIDKKSIMIFQGVTNEYESQKVWKMTQEFKFEELKGSIKDKRALTKVCAIDNSTVCLLGGERLLVEFFDLHKSDNVQNDFSMEIESALTKAIYIDGQIDKSLKNFSFA